MSADALAALSLVISLASLGLSLFLTWLLHFRRGTLKMTQPQLVFFGYDHVPKTTAKVFLRCLLYSTSQRGQVIEAMFVRLRRGEAEDVFSFWGYGETTELRAGGGLFVGPEGVAANHHYVRSVHMAHYKFDPGQYQLDVFARTAGKRRAVRLVSTPITLSDENAHFLAGGEGILFELEPDDNAYKGHPRLPPGDTSG